MKILIVDDSNAMRMIVRRTLRQAGFDGHDVTDGIHVNFGFVTTERTTEMRDRAANAGAKFLIVKPFTPEDFQAALMPLLG